MSLLIVAVAIAIALFWAARARELFCISVRDGRVLLVRGRIPRGLLIEMREVLGPPTPVARGSVRAVRREDGARLVFAGDIDEGRAQRLRNCFAIYPMSQLRAAPPIQNATVGQLLGIAWLAWLFNRN